jgi:hypothetical protein
MSDDQQAAPPPAWLSAEDPQVVFAGAMGSLDEALQGLAAGGDTAAAAYVVPRAAAASAGFAFLDREGFAAVGRVILAPLAEVTYALLRAVAEGGPDDVEAAVLGVCCALDVDLADLAN